MSKTTLEMGRSLILSVRVQFSPQMQSIRDEAIDRIVEQALYISKDPLNSKQLEAKSTLLFVDNHRVLPPLRIEHSLERLSENGHVLRSEEQHTSSATYQLDEDRRQELSEVEAHSVRCMRDVVSEVFANSTDTPESYREAFFYCLCAIFSRLGGAYVDLLTGKKDGTAFLSDSDLDTSIRTAKNRGVTAPSWPELRNGLVRFFVTSTPKYNTIKWNLAQNYYITKTLGADPDGHLLSKDVFSGSVFYIDTNVVITALETAERHHRTFHELRRACDALDIKLLVASTTLDELSGVVTYYRKQIGKVVTQIPAATLPKVRGIFLQIYNDAVQKDADVDVDSAFAQFDNARAALEGDYGIGYDGSGWFVDAAEEKETKDLLNMVQKVCRERRGCRNKPHRAALHDALLLRYVRQLQSEAPKTWILTLDSSLPYVNVDGTTSSQPVAFTMPALLQWLSPLAAIDQDRLAEVYADALQYELLPHEEFFTLEDFQIFADMDFDCSHLPEEDVEECIRFVRKNFAALDTSNPLDREKLQHVIGKFFANPARKYQKELADAKRREEAAATLAEAERQRAKDAAQKVNEIQYKADEAATNHSVREWDLEREVETLRLRAEAWPRLIPGAFLTCVLLTGVIYAGVRYGDTSVVWVRRLMGLDHWFYVLPFVIGTVVSGFVLGKKRIIALGWPWNKILGAD